MEEPVSRTKYTNASGIMHDMLADVGGVNASFNAYRAWLEMHPNEEITLPWLKGMVMPFAPPDQMFFILQGQLWCHNHPAASIDLSGGGHPFQYHRVNIPVMNSPDFAKAFQCEKGSRMNPINKCSLG